MKKVGRKSLSEKRGPLKGNEVFDAIYCTGDLKHYFKMSEGEIRSWFRRGIITDPKPGQAGISRELTLWNLVEAATAKELAKFFLASQIEVILGAIRKEFIEKKMFVSDMVNTDEDMIFRIGVERASEVWKDGDKNQNLIFIGTKDDLMNQGFAISISLNMQLIVFEVISKLTWPENDKPETKEARA